MIKTLRNVGNRKGIGLSSALIKRYDLKKVTIEATEAGILIRPVRAKNSFQKKMELARKNKTVIYKKMQKEASDPRTVAFYNHSSNTFAID